jgi:hypothetical protein
MKRICRLALYLVALVALLPAYVISTGPVYWLFNQGYITQRQWNAFYAPLGWSSRQSAAIDRVGDQYLDWWAPSVQ